MQVNKLKRSHSEWSCWNSPLGFDVCAGADVILGGEHKLVVKYPLRFVVQHGGGVQLYDLVVLHGQVVACALQVSNLFKPQQDGKPHEIQKKSKQVHTHLLLVCVCVC